MRVTHKIVALTEGRSEQKRSNIISEHDPLNHGDELSVVIDPSGEKIDLEEVNNELREKHKHQNFVYHIQLDPFNIARLNFSNRKRLPLVICLADTHHGHYPLKSLLSLSANLYPLGFIYLFNNRHAILTEKMGVIAKSDSVESGRVLPIVGKRNWLERESKLLHTGSLSTYHKRREDAVNKLRAKESNFEQFNSNYQEYWNKHTNSMFSINISLNGDRNIRFWQSLLAGNLLIQERLDPKQYLDIPNLRPGIDFYEFGSISEAIDIYRKCKENLGESRTTALKASKIAYEYFMKRETRVTMVYRMFWEWKKYSGKLYTPEVYNKHRALIDMEDELTRESLDSLIPV
tara:strand:+ start:110 stop:1150 length:1041 start_codon:yes stop_codon:yes gene_type:complete